MYEKFMANKDELRTSYKFVRIDNFHFNYVQLEGMNKIFWQGIIFEYLLLTITRTNHICYY